MDLPINKPTGPEEAQGEQRPLEKPSEQDKLAEKTGEVAATIGGKISGWTPTKRAGPPPRPIRKPFRPLPPIPNRPEAQKLAEISLQKGLSTEKAEGIKEELETLTNQIAWIEGSQRRAPRAYVLVGKQLGSILLEGAPLEKTKEAARQLIHDTAKLLKKITSLKDGAAQTGLFTDAKQIAKNLATCKWIQELDSALPDDEDLKISFDVLFSELCKAELAASKDTARQDLLDILDKIPKTSTRKQGLQNALEKHKELETPIKTYTKIELLEKRLNALGKEHKLVTTTAKIEGKAETKETSQIVKRKTLGRFFSRTGASKNAGRTAQKQLQIIKILHGELKELKKESPQEASKYEAKLKNAFTGLTKSEWFQGAVRHHNELNKPLLDMAKSLLPQLSPETMGEWIRFADNFTGTYAMKGIKDHVETLASSWTNELWSEEILALDQQCEKALLSRDAASLFHVASSLAQIKKNAPHLDPENEKKLNDLQAKLRENISSITAEVHSNLHLDPWFPSIHEAQSSLDLLATLVENDKTELLNLQKASVEARTTYVSSCVSLLTAFDPSQAADIDSTITAFSTALTIMTEAERAEAYKQIEENKDLDKTTKKELLNTFKSENYRRILQCAIEPDQLQTELFRERLHLQAELHSQTPPELLEKAQEFLSLLETAPELLKTTSELLNLLKKPPEGLDTEIVSIKTELLKRFEKAPELYKIASELLNMAPEKAKTDPQFLLIERLKTSCDNNDAFCSLAEEASILLPLGKQKLFTLNTLQKIAQGASSKKQIAQTKRFLLSLAAQWGSLPTSLSKEEKKVIVEIAKALGDPKTEERVLELITPAPKTLQILTGPIKADKENAETISGDLFSQSASIFTFANLAELTAESAQKALVSMKDQSEKIGYFVVTDILTESKTPRTLEFARERSLFWADVATKSLERGDIATSFAIYSALQKTPVDRLNKPQASSEYGALSQHLKHAFDPVENFSNIRNLMKEKKEIIPHIAFYLPFVEQNGAKTFPEGGALPMRLLDMHYKCIAPLFTFQKNLAASSPSFSAKTDINDMVNRYDVPEKEDGFYSLSQEILPRPKHP